MALQLRRGTDAERTANGGVVFAEGELAYITDTEEVYVGDGTTPGGIRITGSAVGSPSALTQNLSLAGFSISGSGTISATAFIGDGSGLTNVGGGGTGVIDGQEYSISIKGDVTGADSGIIVDSQNSIVYADFVGNGSLITDIEIGQLTNVVVTSPVQDQVLTYQGGTWVNADAAVIPASFVGDVTGSVFRDDSTPIVDGLTGNIYPAGLYTNANSLSVLPSLNGSENKFAIRATDSNSNLTLQQDSAADLSGGNNLYGQVIFARNDSNGAATTARIRGFENSLEFSSDSTSSFATGETTFVWTDGKIGIGNTAPSTKLHITDGSIRLDDSRAYVSIVGPSQGELQYTNGDLYLYDGAEWNKLLSSDVTLGITRLFGPLIPAGVTNAELDGVGTDSTVLDGAIVYNTDQDRVQVFQAGSWVGMPNNGAAIGEILTWNGTEWAAAQAASGGDVVNAQQLGNQLPAFYLDYNNFTNTPTLFDGVFGSLTGTPTTIAGYGISDAFDGVFGSLTSTPTTLAGYGISDAATSTQGSTADTALQPAALGNFTFTASVLDSSDSGGITITPAVTVSSDLTVENNLVVTNTVTAERFISTSAETPEITAATNLNLTAGNAVRITSSVLRLASFTTTERNALAGQNGDIIYNTTDNKFQGYENGAWANLI